MLLRMGLGPVPLGGNEGRGGLGMNGCFSGGPLSVGCSLNFLLTWIGGLGYSSKLGGLGRSSNLRGGATA